VRHLAEVALAAALAAVAAVLGSLPLGPDRNDIPIARESPTRAEYTIVSGQTMATYRYQRRGTDWTEVVIDVRSDGDRPAVGDVQAFVGGCYVRSSPTDPGTNFTGCGIEVTAPREELSTDLYRRIRAAVMRTDLEPDPGRCPDDGDCMVLSVPEADPRGWARAGFDHGTFSVLLERETGLAWHLSVTEGAEEIYTFAVRCMEPGPVPCEH